MDSSVVVASELFTICDATLFHFGVLTSTMHMAWVRAVCGRLESRYRYSAQIVYNNFPWPQKLEEKHRAAIEMCAQAVLDAAPRTPAPRWRSCTIPPPCRRL